MKVGKAKAKAANFTDTSFKSKGEQVPCTKYRLKLALTDTAIVIKQQSLSRENRDSWREFKDDVALASTSRAEAHRRDALTRLTERCSATAPDPWQASQLLDVLSPMMSDRDSSVRGQLLKLFHVVPPSLVKPKRAEKLMMFVRAAMTHMAADVRHDSLAFLDWLLDAQPHLVLACPGGWPKTLRTFVVMLGWSGHLAGPVAAAGADGWTSAPRTTFGADMSGTAFVKQLKTLTRFVDAGLSGSAPESAQQQSLGSAAAVGRDDLGYLWRLPRTSFPYAYLSVDSEDEYSRHYLDEEMRRDFFRERIMEGLLKGLDEAKREGGAAGRAAKGLEVAIQDAMDDFREGSVCRDEGSNE